MSLLHSDAFLAHLSQFKSEAKQQVNSMIDAIYAKVLLDLELWLNKDKDRNDSVHGLGLNHNDATDEQMQSMSTNTQQMHENVNCPPSLQPSHLQSHSNHFSIKTKDDEVEVNSRVIQFDPNEKSIHLDSISNPKQSSQSQPMTIKEEIDPLPVGHVQSSSCAPVSNEQPTHNLKDQRWNNHDELDNCQINLPDIEMQTQPQQFAPIKHNEHDDEECDCKECVDGGIEVKEDDNDDQMNESLSRPVKRPRMDSTQPNNAQAEMTRQSPRQPTDETQSNEDRPDGDGDQMASGQSEDNDTRSSFEDNFHDKSIVISLESSDRYIDTSNAIEGEFTTNPIHPNFVQQNGHLQCLHCRKSFVSNSKLQRHLRVHTGERPFKCDQCDKQFKQLGTLTTHQLIHQNIKRFRCDQCDKQFAQKHRLDSHLRTHSGDRPFECRHCENSFTTSDNRNMHEQAIHLHVKPYRCKQCGHTATDRAAVIRHVRMVHFSLPRYIQQQQTLNIIDQRDPRELIEKV